MEGQGAKTARSHSATGCWATYLDIACCSGSSTDGRRCISTPRGQDANPGDEPLLLPTRGDGSNGVGSAGWFLSPFPPPGDLRLYCAWPSAGIPETTTFISADELLKAARRVRQLWPPSRIFDQQPTPTPVVLPPDGWFMNSGLTADTP